MTTPPDLGPSRAGTGYLPGLDGLRALAVLVVCAFHFDVVGLTGGFLGVDVFFVLSGYLITGQLWARWSNGPVSLSSFWAGRVRRLAPAVLVMLLGTSVAMALLDRPLLRDHLRDVAAAGTWTSNWWYVADERSYAAHWGLERPPLLQHLWSLAIEEQFYLLWPLLVLALLRVTGRRPQGNRLGLLVATLLAIASATWLGLGSARAGVPDPLDITGDPLRWYYGTDSHAMGLLAGAGLAFAHAGRLRKGKGLPSTSLMSDLAGLAALAVVLWLCRVVDYRTAWLYRYGFVVVTLASLVLVATVTRRGPLQRVFSTPPMRWLGTRSYAVYLWHWPVACFTRPGIDLPLEYSLWVRVALTVALAEASHRLVELPVRTLGWRRACAAIRPPRRAVPLAVLVAASVAVVSWAAASTPRRGVEEALRPDLAHASFDASVPMPSSTSSPSARPRATRVPSRQPATRPTTTAALRLAYYGDSFALGAEPGLAKVFDSVEVVGRVGEQSWELLPRLERDAAGLKADVVLLHTGNNGIVREDELAAALDALADAPRVVVVLPAVQRPWAAQAQAAITAVCGTADSPRRANVRVVDWAAAAGSRTKYLADGVHPTAEGVELYTRLVQVAALRP